MIKPMTRRIVSVLLTVGWLALFVPWALNLFGIIKYDIPLSQDRQNIERIEILDSEQWPYEVIQTLTGQEMETFADLFLQIRARRYANDPPTNQGRYTVRICYQNGGYDDLGIMVKHFSPSGDTLSTKGLYYIPSRELYPAVESCLNHSKNK